MTSPVRRLFRRNRSATDNALVHVARAKDAFATGATGEGRNAVAQALKAAPGDVEIHLDSARALKQAGLIQDALSIHRHLMEMPDPPSESIIVVTADTAIDLRERCLTAGADEVLFKPVAMDALFDTIGRVLALRSGGEGMLI